MSRLLLLFALLHATSICIAEEPLRFFDVYKVPEAGLIIYNPGSPEWDIDVLGSRKNGKVILSTPALYFPPTSVEIQLDRNFSIEESDLEEVAEEMAKSLRIKTNANETNVALEPIQYGDIVAVKDEFETTYNGEKYTIQHVIGRMPSGRVIRMMATSSTNHLDAIQLMLHKIYSNLIEI